MSQHQIPSVGDRVRITRRRDGKIRFVKTGTIRSVSQHGYGFAEDGSGLRFCAASQHVEAMPGWTQTIELCE